MSLSFRFRSRLPHPESIKVVKCRHLPCIFRAYICNLISNMVKTIHHVPNEKPLHLGSPAASSQRLYTCKWSNCNKSFPKKYSLKVHSRVHSGEKPYHCSTKGCFKTFKWRSSQWHHRARCQPKTNHNLALRCTHISRKTSNSRRRYQSLAPGTRTEQCVESSIVGSQISQGQVVRILDFDSCNSEEKHLELDNAYLPSPRSIMEHAQNNEQAQHGNRAIAPPRTQKRENINQITGKRDSDQSVAGTTSTAALEASQESCDDIVRVFEYDMFRILDNKSHRLHILSSPVQVKNYCPLDQVSE